VRTPVCVCVRVCVCARVCVPSPSARLRPRSQEHVGHTWALSVLLGFSLQWRRAFIELLWALALVHVADRYTLLHHRAWFERHLDIVSIQARTLMMRAPLVVATLIMSRVLAEAPCSQSPSGHPPHCEPHAFPLAHRGRSFPRMPPTPRPTAGHPQQPARCARDGLAARAPRTTDARADCSHRHAAVVPHTHAGHDAAGRCRKPLRAHGDLLAIHRRAAQRGVVLILGGGACVCGGGAASVWWCSTVVVRI
jgi:hypothetical protein